MVEALNPPNGEAPHYELAQAIKYAEMPKSLFRLRSATDDNIDAFRKDTIWLPHAGSFNDPFDSAYALSADQLIKVRGNEGIHQILDDPRSGDFYSKAEKDRIKNAKDSLIEAIDIFIEKDTAIPTAKKVALKSELYAGATHTLQGLLAKIVSRGQRSVRVACFTESLNSIVMWSHYASNHSGFALEYQLKPVVIKALNSQLWPVVYSQKFYDGTGHFQKPVSPKMKSHLPLIAALHKSTEWEYEREWRLVVPLGETDDPIFFSDAKPVAVYLGARMSGDGAHLLREEALKKGISVYQMQIAHDSFSLAPTAVITA